MTITADVILSMGAAQLAVSIRRGDLTPTDIIEAHIARIQQVNPYINAIIIPMFAQARAQAQQATERIAAGDTDDLPPLFGVPVTIKDSWAVAGERFVGGSWYHRGNVADEDAPLVQRMKDAGAIILGKTNCPDMCWLAETVNPVFGRTNNPWDLDYTAGGSSGGEGAIVAAGGSPLGIGSDIAGSVRIPAAATGIVSLKPTGGRVPNAGHVPAAPDAISTWNTAGPMARRVDDLALALRVLSDSPVRDYHDIDLRRRRLTVYINNRLVPVRGPVRDTVSMAAGALDRAGMDVVRDETLPLVQATFAFSAIFAKQVIPGLKRDLGGGKAGKAIRVRGELIKHLRGRSKISSQVLFLTAFIELSGRLFSRFGYADPTRLDTLRQRMIDAMTPGGLLLCPILVTPPPKHNWTYGTLWQVPYSFMFNALGFPAAVVPIRMSKAGLPLCVQIVGTPDDDETVLRVAAELEAIYGGWQMADPIR